jgi:hypothetical protein
MEQVPFGSTGLTVSRLAFGTGSHGWDHRSEQTDLGIEGLARLLCAAYDAGVTFWDGADMYGSHPHLARALQTVPRDRVVITTKTLASTREGSRRGALLPNCIPTCWTWCCCTFSAIRLPDSRAGAMEASAGQGAGQGTRRGHLLPQPGRHAGGPGSPGWRSFWPRSTMTA